MRHLGWYGSLVDSGRAAMLWLLVGFVVTFAVTRWITVTIRRRAVEHPGHASARLRDVHIGGVHVHHQVWGILLLLVTGFLEFRFRPESPGLEIVAVLFGAGAALALDEFALWLHLEDVYWSQDGRKSIDAVVITLVIGIALLVGTSPIGVDAAQIAQEGWAVTAVVLVLHIATTVLCLLKGKIATGLVGLPIPGVAIVGAIRLAQPASFWARRRYSPEKMAAAAVRQARVDARRERMRTALSGIAHHPAAEGPPRAGVGTGRRPHHDRRD